jgi:energy-coupling factor transporter transmembrane protein EcfT
MATTEFNLLRCLPGTNPLRRVWAGTKLVAAAALGIAVVADPSWPTLGIGALVLLLGAAVTRFPAGALPRLPRWFFLLLLAGAVLDFTAGGSPEIEVGTVTIGLGGIEAWLRFTSLGVVVFGIAILLGATTPVAELPAAVDRLCAPLRAVRLPVDEFVAAFTLVVRAFPLLLDEVRTLYAAWRLRRPVLPRGLRVVTELHNVLITAIAASLRRARDLARAIDARGGLTGVARPPLRIGLRDAVTLLVTGAAVTAIVLV